MSWRKEIAQVLAEAPKEYTYDPAANQFESRWLPYPPLTATKISSPVRRLRLPEGDYDFVIVKPWLKQLLHLPRVTLLISHPKEKHKHGELARTRNVLAAGQIRVREEDGSKVVSKLTNGSGHYEPGEKILELTERVMNIFRVPVSKNLQRARIMNPL